ncbi:MAG TPA: membrane protein insertase YidC, partial [bacterium]|nr:membrane protein insertase YidC [bacterium]
MDKRVLLASILSLLVLVTFQYWQTKTAPRPTAPAVMGAAPDQGPADTAPADAPAVAAAPAVQPLPAAAAAPIGREVIVETDLYRAVFTTRGGKLVSLGLKHYLRRKKPPFQAENETRFETLRPDGQPAADLTVLPFELVGSDTMLYRPSTESLLLSKSNPKGELVLQAESGGQPITKRFRFDNDRYGLELEMSGAAAPGLDLGAFSLAPPTSGQKQPEELIFAADGKISRLRAGGRNKNLPLEQKSVLYLARQGQYLLTILKPIETLPARIEADAYGNLGARFRAAGGPGRGNRFYFYSGPSDYQILKREGVGIPEIMPSGPMVALSRFIMSILTFFHRIIP